MNRRNLRKTINFLKNSPPPIFNMDSWFEIRDIAYTSYGDVLRLIEREQIKKPECGTSACLAGTIQFNAAKTLKEKNTHAISFATTFLNVPYSSALILFTHSETYGTDDLNNVKQIDVENTLIALDALLTYEPQNKSYSDLSLLDHLNALPKIKPSRRY